MEMKVAPDPGLREDTPCLTNGGWVKYARGINAFVPVAMSSKGQGAFFQDTIVELKPLCT